MLGRRVSLADMEIVVKVNLMRSPITSQQFRIDVGIDCGRGKELGEVSILVF